MPSSGSIYTIGIASRLPSSAWPASLNVEQAARMRLFDRGQVDKVAVAGADRRQTLGNSGGRQSRQGQGKLPSRVGEQQRWVGRDDAVSLFRRVWPDRGEVRTMTGSRWARFLADFSRSHTCRRAPSSYPTAVHGSVHTSFA
jgi:hypothetical protein